MDILKKVALGILSPLFIFLLFATAFDIGFVRTATHPGTVKRLVAESGIYDSVIPSLLQQTKSIQTSVGTISASDPLIQNAANQAITPQYVKQNTETAIDSVYKWLDGDIAQPDFKIDLSGAKTNFADQVASDVQQKLAGLPACTTAQNTLIAQNGYDAINATCLPRGITAASAAGLVKSDLASSQDFLKNPTISSQNIQLDQSQQGEVPNTVSRQQPFFQRPKTQEIPKQYQRAKKTPLILSILTILTGVGIVFLSSSWQKGLRHVGINLVIIGVLMLLFSYGLNRVVSKNIAPKVTFDNAALQKDIRSLVTDLGQQIDKNYWFFGGLYTVLGAGSITAAEIYRRRAQPAHEPVSKGAPETGDAKDASSKKKS